MKRFASIAASLFLVACASTGTHSAKPPAKAAPDALYHTLGEQEGIGRLVDAALKRIHGDLRISIFFEKTDLPDLRRLFIEQICAASGGPCTYSGRSMEEAHSGMNLTDADFSAFVEDLITAMNDVKIDAATQKTILGVFGPMKPQIVGQ